MSTLILPGLGVERWERVCRHIEHSHTATSISGGGEIQGPHFVTIHTDRLMTVPISLDELHFHFIVTCIDHSGLSRTCRGPKDMRKALKKVGFEPTRRTSRDEMGKNALS
jgi:hypothetical protein